MDGNIFEKALEESNMQQVKEAAAQMYQIYREFCEVGFTKTEAMTLLIAMLNNGGKRPEKKDSHWYIKSKIDYWMPIPVLPEK